MLGKGLPMPSALARLPIRRLSRIAAVLALGCLMTACATRLSNHPVIDSDLGTLVSSGTMLRALQQPGTVKLRTVTVADWRFSHVSAPQRGQPWQTTLLDAEILTYVVHHPQHGLILIDAGVPADTPRRLGPILRRVLAIDQTFDLRQSIGQILAEREAGTTPRAVFLTHLHFDHVLGLVDLPEQTPVHVGPGEGDHTDVLHAFIAPVTAQALRGRPPLRAWAFAPDPDGRLEGVIDVFGDGSIFAIHVPGHTPGSTAYVVNAVDGVHLITGDAVHGRAAWTGAEVERNAFDRDLPRLYDSLAQLQAIATRIPGVIVHPGHQHLED